MFFLDAFKRKRKLTFLMFVFNRILPYIFAIEINVSIYFRWTKFFCRFLSYSTSKYIFQFRQVNEHRHHIINEKIVLLWRKFYIKYSHLIWKNIAHTFLLLILIGKWEQKRCIFNKNCWKKRIIRLLVGKHLQAVFK